MEPVDEMVTEVVLTYLASQRLQLARKDSRQGADLQALLDERAALTLRANEASLLQARGEITADEWRVSSAEISRLSKIVERKIDEATNTSPLATALLSEGGIRAIWNKLNPLQRSKIVDSLVEVTIHKTDKRGKFDPDAIEIRFK